MIAYGSCVGSWDKLRRNVIPWVSTHGGHLIAASGQPSIGKAYNAILNSYRGRDLSAVVLLHDDLEITDPLFEHKVIAALMGERVALVGVAGGKSDRSLHWWNGEKVGHQMTDSGLLDFGARTGDVAFIEGSVMVFSPWAVEHLRFDERYPGFSAGYDDICVEARGQGMRVVVTDADTWHHSTVGWKSPDAEAKFAAAEEMFREKWGVR